MAPPTTPTHEPRHATIFGGTGRTGRHLVEQALEAGHHVTVLARTPGKLAFQHERLRVVEGDVQDLTAVARAIEGDQPKLFNHLISFVLRIAARHVLEDMTRTVQAVRSSDLDWTVVRVPMLTDDPAKGSVRVGHVGVNTGPRVTRADMARFMLEQLTDTAHVGASPVISN